MRIKSQRFLASIMALAVSASLLSACGGTSSAPSQSVAPSSQLPSSSTEGSATPANNWKFERRVEIMVPASEGGGLDTTIRAFSPYLEKELGVNVVINNRSGGSGITGYTWSKNSANDGYSFQFTAPSAILAAAQGKAEFDLMGELIPVSGLTNAEAIFFSGKNVPFKTAQEMIDYCKANPGKVSIATDSPNGITGALITEFCNQAGIELKWITSDSNEANISLIAGEVDLYIGTWSDAGAYVESGDINALVMLSEERSPLFPAIPCVGEMGYSAELGFYRVFTAMKGTPQEAVDAFTNAVFTAAQNPEWEAWLNKNGMVNNYVFSPEELADVLKLSYDIGATLANK